MRKVRKDKGIKKPPRSVEWCENIRKARYTAKKRKFTGQALLNIQEANKKRRGVTRVMSIEWLENIRNSSKKRIGIKVSEKARRNMCIGQQKRLPRTKETRLKMSKAQRGEKNWKWKGGIKTENQKIRNGINMRFWREDVFKRDNFTCQITGKVGGILEAHHIIGFAKAPELRFEVSNGITMSKKVHRDFHKKYGYNTTKEQIEEFKGIRWDI